MPASRTARTTLRTAHVMAIAAYYGGSVHGVSAERLEPALFAVYATGSAFLLFEAWRSPLWVVQIRGFATYAKLGLLVAASALPQARVALLSAVLAIGVVVSHMPARFRYYSLVHRRVIGDEEKG
jgi:hypothetical protein